MKKALPLVVLTGLSLSACIRPPAEQPLRSAVTAKDVGLSAVTIPPAPDGWWKVCGDPQLVSLVDHTLAGNPSLQTAMARLQAANDAADAVDANRYPRAGFDAQEIRQRFSGNDVVPPPYGRNVYWRGGAATNLSWDLDFWGRQAALVAQARKSAQADALDVAATRLLLSSSLARTYESLDHAYALIDIAHRTIGQRQNILNITARLVAGGISTQVELREARGALAEARLELDQAEEQRDLATHQIAMLAGLGADAYAGIKRPAIAGNIPLTLPQSLPADLLIRRPDILAARWRIDAADSGRKAAKAAFYPDVSLTAFAGYSAIGFDTLFRYSSFDYGLGPAVHLPLFDAGRLKAEYRGATAELDTAITQYNEVVIRAVQQTADALTAVASIEHQRGDQKAALDDAQAAYTLASERYRAGLTSYITVLTAETALLAAQRGLVDLDASLMTARVHLLLTVGGSFKPPRDLPPLELSRASTSLETQP